MQLQETSKAPSRWGLFGPLLGVALGLLVSTPAPGSAQDIATAADAFSRAQQAELAGDFALASSLYALADSIAPTVEALRSAARTAHSGGLTASAATYAAELLRREGDDSESRDMAREILAATESELTRVTVSCPAECRVLIDGKLTFDRGRTEHTIYARPGTRELSASFSDGLHSDTKPTTMVAGGQVSLVLTPSKPSPAERTPEAKLAASEELAQPDEREGLPRWVFGSALALTTAAAGVAAWSALDVRSAHDKYDPAAADAQRRYDRGRELERRTNLLFGVAGGLAAATLVTALFTQWTSDSEETDRGPSPGLPIVQLGPTTAWVGWKGTLR